MLYMFKGTRVLRMALCKGAYLHVVWSQIMWGHLGRCMDAAQRTSGRRLAGEDLNGASGAADGAEAPGDDATKAAPEVVAAPAMELEMATVPRPPSDAQLADGSEYTNGDRRAVRQRQGAGDGAAMQLEDEKGRATS